MRLIPMRFLFILLFALQSCVWGQSPEYKEMLKEYYDGFPTISLADAKSKLGAKNVFFLDTREKAEYNVSHIEGAWLVGYDNFSIGWLKKIPRGATVIVYCSIGARSQYIGHQLKDAGYTHVFNLYGGLFHWVNSGYPVVNSKGPTSRIHGYSKSWGKWITRGEIVY